MRQPHTVPLSRQAIAILQAAQALTGRHRYVFASLYPGKRPMSENTINAALRRLGYSGDEMTAQGFLRFGRKGRAGIGGGDNRLYRGQRKGGGRLLRFRHCCFVFWPTSLRALAK